MYAATSSTNSSAQTASTNASGTLYRVQQGDHIMKIAVKFGFSDYKTLWDHPKNAALKQKRKNPNVLAPGDLLFIPPKNGKQEAGRTTQNNAFQTPGANLNFRLRLQNQYTDPLKQTKCLLKFTNQAFNKVTDGEGSFEQRIPTTAEQATLDLPEQTLAFRIGHLDPVAEVSGQVARLLNLGYYLGRTDKVDVLQLRSAVEEFQCDHHLKITGVQDAATQSALEKAHGC